MKLSYPKPFTALYKYTKKQWVDDMLRRGKFRIGTLYEYRATEHTEIGDRLEGIRQISFSNGTGVAGLTSSELNSLFPKLRLGSVSPEVIVPVRPDNAAVPVAIEVHAPDCYIYCLTRRFDPDVMQKFGYDACIEISNPQAFFMQLSRAMRPHASFGSMASCFYASKYGFYDQLQDCPPQLHKPEALRHQEEVRITWDPLLGRLQSDILKSSLRPIFITRPKATKFCRQIA